ncbi:MAG: pitrilysin family protein [Nanoarchaeota archaeon]
MKFMRKKLKNGVTVIMEKREIPVVAFSISNKFGAAFEESKIKGIAHFMEHLVFTGTKTRSHEDISREIEKKGGVLNAFTANEVTSFWFKLPSEHMFSGIDILIDMLKNPIFKEDKFEKEKKVILEEIKMGHDEPQRDVYDNILENLYEKPFGEGVIGRQETIQELKRDFVFDYFKKAYSPENYIISIVGDADFEEVCAYIEKNFEKREAKIAEKEIKKINKESAEEREGIDQAHFIFGVHAPLRTDENYSALEALNAYLAEGMSSKLFLKIREEKGLAYAIRGSIETEKNYSWYGIYVGTMKDAIPEVKKIILEELEKMQEMNEKELEEVKIQLIGLRKISNEESTKVMVDLLFAELAEKADRYYEYENRIKKVRLEDVKKLAKTFIEKYSTAVIVPK